MVRVLVGEKKGDKFPGFWAEFEGDMVSSHGDTRGGNRIVYTLYRCTAYQWEAFRVHVADESDPTAPVYELHPFSEQTGIGGVRSDYSEPFDKEGIAAQYPLFLKDLDYFREYHVDPTPRGF